MQLQANAAEAADTRGKQLAGKQSRTGWKAYNSGRKCWKEEEATTEAAAGGTDARFVDR